MFLVLTQNLGAESGFSNVDEILLELFRAGRGVHSGLFKGAERSVRGNAVAFNDGLRVDLLVDQLLGLAQQLGSKHGDGGRAIANLVVLHTRDVDKHFGGRVVKGDGFENRSTVIGHEGLVAAGGL